MDLIVVYSSDNLYAQHLGVSMISLFETNKEFKNIKVKVIENAISLNNKKNLTLICERYNREIEFVDFKNYSHKLNLDIGNSISINSYARLFLSSVLDLNIDKVLYLDCDSIINASLSELWRTDISGYYIAGVSDTVSNTTKLKVNMNTEKPYINAGMLLINLKRWRKEGMEKKFLDFISYYNGNVYHHDQGTINGVLNEKVLLLHPKYNSMSTFYSMTREQIILYYGMKDYYSELELNQAKNNPVFIHYTPAFVNRPWIKGSKHPQKSVYEKYLRMSPWVGVNSSKDNRSKGEKVVAFLFNNLPFRMANSLCKLIFK